MRLIVDMHDVAELPANFRVVEELSASASGQFSITSLALLKQKLHPETLFIDLRQECHGFANDLAICWYGPQNRSNVGKNLSQIVVDEKKLLQSLLGTDAQIFAKDPKIAPFSVAVSSVKTESELVECVRIPVTDHERPSDEAVEQFVELVQTKPKWLHIHCRKGRGRSTTFLALLDMLKNAKRYTFDQIMQRSLLFGGSDLMYVPPAEDPKHEQKIHRIQLLKKFYQSSLTFS